MLTVKALKFAYPGQTSPYDFSLQVAPGEIVAISGSSGSGKSTLLDLVAGFSHPSSGDLALNGHDLVHLPPEDRPVSVLFQSNNVFDHLTAAQNLRLGLPRDHNATTSTTLISDALNQMQLEGLENRRCEKMSGGQKQRVALARTLLRDKPVLLLDEPFSGLDDATAETVRELVHKIVRERQWHCLLVTHDENDIKALADKRYDIRDNRLIQAQNP
jgi:thiamine transport system ATP-binding protein